jgi:hypothetical protein
VANFKYIEVGTSDFDTICQSAPTGTAGISMDPVGAYLRRLPDKPGNIKIEAALVPERQANPCVYWVEPDVVKDYGLPSWVRGCGSVGTPHKTVLALLKRKSLPANLISCKSCQAITPGELLTEFDVGHVDVLKLDTEGMDNRLLTRWITDSEDVGVDIPTIVWWECNSLSRPDETRAVQESLKRRCYELVRANSYECVMTNDFVSARRLLEELRVADKSATSRGVTPKP